MANGQKVNLVLRQIELMENSPISDPQLVFGAALQSFVPPGREVGIEFFHLRNHPLLRL
jgi:hypothetical protein